MGAKHKLEGKGIQLGGTVKCSGAVLDSLVFSKGGMKKANEEAGRTEKKAQGTQKTQAIFGSQW